MSRPKLPKRLKAESRLAVRNEQRVRFDRLKRKKLNSYDYEMFEEILSDAERKNSLSSVSGSVMGCGSEQPHA